MIDPRYKAQADLLLQAIPEISKEENLALKGGTAINLFLRDMPRLSIDIDLTYIPIEDRITSLQNISETLNRIKGILKILYLEYQHLQFQMKARIEKSIFS